MKEINLIYVEMRGFVLIIFDMVVEIHIHVKKHLCVVVERECRDYKK